MTSRPRPARLMNRHTLFSSILLLLALLLVACGGGGGTSSTTPPKSGQQVPLTIVPNTLDTLVRNFNPYNSSYFGSQGTIYETLLYFNRVTGEIKPWLASSYEFASDATSITFHMRDGVKWSDGKDLTSEDVIFTLELLKKYQSMDTTGIWPNLKSISAPDAKTVTVTLTKPYTPLLWYLGGQTYILPKHIWSKVEGDPSQFANPDPVGSGPFMFKSFTPQLITEVKNPNYWQPGKPAVNEIRYPAYGGNTSAELALQKGDILWTGLFIPNIEKTYISKDPKNNHYWFPSSDPVMIYTNLKKAPFDQLAVRQAISAAIDRQQVSEQGEYGYEPPAHPTGLVLPMGNDFLASEYANLAFTVDTAKSAQLLEGAGFTKGSDGIYVGKDGKQLAFNLDVVNGWTDWITSCQIIAKNLEAAGMKVNVNVIEFDAYYDNLQKGNFDTAISWTNPGPTPFYVYDALLRSGNSAPLGQNASSNFQRWEDPATDKLLDQFATSTDEAVQKQAMSGIQKIMVEQMPTIPLMNEPYWSQYSTKHFTGWPTADNPYALPSPYSYPDNAVVLVNLQPV